MCSPTASSRSRLSAKTAASAAAHHRQRTGFSAELPAADRAVDQAQARAGNSLADRAHLGRLNRSGDDDGGAVAQAMNQPARARHHIHHLRAGHHHDEDGVGVGQVRQRARRRPAQIRQQLTALGPQVVASHIEAGAEQILRHAQAHICLDQRWLRFSLQRSLSNLKGDRGAAPAIVGCRGRAAAPRPNGPPAPTAALPWMPAIKSPPGTSRLAARPASDRLLYRRSSGLPAQC